MKKRKKGLYYCQYLVGIGHLVRSLNICRSLIKKFDVDFLLGGYDVNISLKSSHFHLLQFPPLGIKDPTAEIGEFEELSKAKREERLEAIEKLTTPYDFLITEIFPFSKWRFKEEIEALILKLKKLNPQCVIACSLRDSFPKHSPDAENAVLDFIDKYYHVIFVHSDPQVYKLEESFDLVKSLKHKLRYTGFIVRPTKIIENRERKKRIVISLGAGSFGEELIYAVVNVIDFFPEYQFIFVKGPKASPEFLNKLTSILKPFKNAKLVSFIKHFPKYLSRSALSISLGGYTIMDVVYTKTPAIVYPTTFYDQYVRSLKFAAFGFLKIITTDDLDPDRLKEVMEKVLEIPSPRFNIDMSGAETTAFELDKFLKK